jgi:hypothetical protein
MRLDQVQPAVQPHDLPVRQQKSPTGHPRIMLTYLVAVQNAAGAFPLFASRDGEAAQRTAVGLSQDHPEALITTTPVVFSQTCLTGSSLLMLQSPIQLAQADGLVELLASGYEPDPVAEDRLDFHFLPDQIALPPIEAAN